MKQFYIPGTRGDEINNIGDTKKRCEEKNDGFWYIKLHFLKYHRYVTSNRRMKMDDECKMWKK